MNRANLSRLCAFALLVAASVVCGGCNVTFTDAFGNDVTLREHTKHTLDAYDYSRHSPTSHFSQKNGGPLESVGNQTGPYTYMGRVERSVGAYGEYTSDVGENRLQRRLWHAEFSAGR